MKDLGLNRFDKTVGRSDAQGASDLGSNYLHGDSDLFVVEACEYRDHLLELSPEVLVITNLEWDHTDWFPSLEAMQATFCRAIEKVPEHGVIVANPGDANVASILAGAKARVIDYSEEPAYTLRLHGEFNQMNARAAAAAARVAYSLVQHQVLHTETIEHALADFHGTWRRFEYKGTTARGALVYDDYAHHPTAVKATLGALRGTNRKATPYGLQGKVYVAFHPHLYSRTRDLLEEFATAFTGADQVYLAPIYAAREHDDGSISSEILAERISREGVQARALPDFKAIEEALSAASEGDIIMTMGAGDIYKVADALVEKGVDIEKTH